MKKVCPEVRSRYKLYESLLLGPKLTDDYDFHVYHTKPSSPRWNVDKMDVEYIGNSQYSAVLHTEVSVFEEGNFKFLLFSHDLMSTPLVNFDSKGATHRNRGNVPYPNQIVTTPHFNRYDENGRRYAYKSEALQNPVTAEELSKVGNCIIHFYEEFNIKHSTAGYPAVYLSKPKQQDLFPIHTEDDPLAHVVKF